MIKPIFKTPLSRNYFFGYYDKSPLSRDNRKLLALKTSFIDHLPEGDDLAEIGYFDLNDPKANFVKIAETRAFNWQQGSMLQWIDDKNSRIIYNDLIDGRFVSTIFDLQTKEKTILPMSYYALSSDSSFALCVDYERHYWCRRAYSYDGVINKDKNRDVVPGDGIFFMDMQHRKVTKIIALENMIEYQPLSSMNGGVHYLEHVMISPNAKRFAFFHRWKMKDGGIYTRLYTANVDGKDLYLLNDSGRMSHFCWKNDFEIFGWGRIANPVNRLRRYANVTRYFIKPLIPIYKRLCSGNAITGTTKASSMFTGDRYILFKDKTSQKQSISLKDLDRDGHPSACPLHEDWILSDTYPDYDQLASVYLYHLKTGKRIEIDKIKSSKEFDNTPCRCDLHPKWSLDGRFIAIDVFHEGVRGIFLYDVSGMI